MLQRVEDPSVAACSEHHNLRTTLGFYGDNGKGNGNYRDYRDYIEFFRDYEALLQGASPLKGCHARPSGWALR